MDLGMDFREVLNKPSSWRVFGWDLEEPGAFGTN
jgi:hypothetical protein